MATKGSRDASLEALFLTKAKVRLYIKEELIERLTEDAHSLGVNRSVLLECLLVKYLMEMKDERCVSQNKIQTKQKASA